MRARCTGSVRIRLPILVNGWRSMGSVCSVIAQRRTRCTPKHMQQASQCHLWRISTRQDIAFHEEAKGHGSMHQLVEKLSHTEKVALAELKALLAQQYGVQDIRLFGSKARGTGHVESDIDLFVVVPDLDWERAKAIYTLCSELSPRHALLTAPTLFSKTELENPLVQATPFHRAIQGEGLPL